MADGKKISELTESATIEDAQFFAVSDGTDTTKVAYSTIKNDLIDYSEDMAEVISPTITATEIDGGHRLTIVDFNGTSTVNVMDGETGPRGPQGIPGPQGETGTFEDLTTEQVQELASYVVDDACVRAFGTVAEMQAAVGLKAGMVCHTNGFHVAGDGGAAYYAISASGTANGMDVLAVGQLFATLVVTAHYVTPEQFGAWGDGTHDDSAYIERLIAFSIANDATPVFGDRKIYALASSLTISSPILVDLHGCTLKYIGSHASTFVNYYFNPALVKDAMLGIINGSIDANSLCDTALLVSGGKRVEVANLRIFNSLVTGIEFNKANYDLWEMHAHDLSISGANESGITVDGMKVTSGVTDSWFDEILISNASNAWLNAVAATNHYRNIHGYAYPAENHPTYGMILGGNNNIFENIVIDTPYDKGIYSSGVANIFRNIEISKFSAESDRIGIIDYDYNTYDTIVAGSDCDIVIQSSASNFISVRNMVNYSRPASDLQFVNGKVPYTFDIDLQSSRATSKFIANFEHRNKYATTNVEYNITLPVTFRGILDYDVFIVQKTVSGHSGYPYTINKASDGSAVGVTFYADTSATVQFDMFIKPFKW